MEPTIKVTKIKNRWHARLMDGDIIIDEIACRKKEDIGFICKEMLRWHDKLGGNSKFASSSRKRQTKYFPVGKIWRKILLEEERKNHEVGNL